jgi:hypothetical protein
MTGPNLPSAVAGFTESPAVVRVGQVAIVESADVITVRISGSNVLVPASYLFPAYEPLLGDYVMIVKQDAQWFVMGTMSGPINSVLPNPSFETGTLGAVPSSWSLTVTSSGAGTPTFTKEENVVSSLSGRHSAKFETLNGGAGAGNSTADVYSSTVDAEEADLWTAAYYLMASFEDGATNLISLETYIQFLDGSGGLVSETLVNSLFLTKGYIGAPFYRRLSLTLIPSGAVAAPAGTSSVRLRLHGDFTLQGFEFGNFYIDYMVLRRVG